MTDKETHSQTIRCHLIHKPPPPQTHFELVMKISSKNKTPVMSKVCAQSISSGTLVINIAQVSSSASFTSMKLHSFERSYSQYIHKFTSTSNHLLCTILDARLHTFKTQVKYRAQKREMEFAYFKTIPQSLHRSAREAVMFNVQYVTFGAHCRCFFKTAWATEV